MLFLAVFAHTFEQKYNLLRTKVFKKDSQDELVIKCAFYAIYLPKARQTSRNVTVLIICSSYDK